MKVLTILEIITLSIFFWSNYRLAIKKRDAWIWYGIANTIIAFILLQKGIYLSATNHVILCGLSLCNVIWREGMPKKYSRGIFFACIISTAIFTTLTLVGDIQSHWSEVFVWMFVFTARILLSKKNPLGWWFTIAQAVSGIVFVLYAELYIFILWNVFILIQAGYGLYKWKKQ